MRPHTLAGLLALKVFLGLVLLVSALVGCGGSSSDEPASQGRGRATLKVLWPARTRLIPNAANSLGVDLLKDGTVVDHKTIARPAAGSTQTQTDFTGLDVATYSVAIKAYPNADGTGIAQATGAGTLNAAIDGTGTVTVSLASTVDTVVVTPAASSVTAGGTTTLTASAKDAQGNLVLLTAGGGTENVVWSSDASTVATVAGTELTATLSGIDPGTANIKASLTTDDAGTVKSGSAPISVVAVAVPVTFQMPWMFNGMAAPAAWKSVRVTLEDTNGVEIEKTIERSGDDSQVSTILDAVPDTYTMTYQVYDAANGAGTKLLERSAQVSVATGQANAYVFGSTPFSAERLALSIRNYGQIPSNGYVYSDFVSHALLTLVWSKTDGTTENVTSSASWSVDNTTIAVLQSRVSGMELVPVRSGNTVVRATLNGQTFSVNASVMYF